VLKRFSRPVDAVSSQIPPLRYLSGSAVERQLPEIDKQLELVRSAYRALREGACETPATPEVAPRPGGFAHALPAYVSDGDITSVKWISGDSSNRERGLPYLSGLIIVNESETGLPIAILDASAITAARTAAASAVCVEAFGGEWSRVAIIGYGVQAEAHIKALSSLNPEATFAVFSRRPLESEETRISFTGEARVAIDGADVVVTGMPLEVKLQPQIEFSWLGPRALVLPLDDDASLDASVANDCQAFFVDDLDDYRARQEANIFAGWRAPDRTIADVILDRAGTEGVVVCANQGMGVLDAVFARHVVDAADIAGAGTLLER
jgi:alanine dehydrogenase